MNNFVNLCRLEDYNLAALEQFVSDSISRLGVKFKAGSNVLIKVCMPKKCKINEAITTHPNLVMAVVNVLTKLDVNCIVADSPYGRYTQTNLDAVYFSSGMLEVANSSKCELNEDMSTTNLPLANGVRAKNITTMGIINKVDAIVNLAKLKMDTRTGYVGALANLFGIIPGNCKNLMFNRQHTLKDYYNLLIDIYELLKDKLVLNIMDGIVARQADGTPNIMAILAASINPYALDAQILNILGMDRQNSIIKPAIERKIVSENIIYRPMGESEANFVNADFVCPEVNLESVLNDNRFANKCYFNSMQQHVTIDAKQCKGCEICSKICPVGAIMMKYDKNGELFATVDYKKCIYCNECFLKCPYKVIKLKTPVGYKSLNNKLSKFNEE